MVLLAVFTITRRTPSTRACSSLYQTLIVAPGAAVKLPTGLNARSTSLSLKMTLVRGLLLEKGYMMLQVGKVIGAPIHVPLLHVSLTVQPFPSLHGTVLFVCVHVPVAGTQLSFVHTLLSLQFFGAPDLQLPFWQMSPMVHSFPSVH